MMAKSYKLLLWRLILSWQSSCYLEPVLHVSILNHLKLLPFHDWQLIWLASLQEGMCFCHFGEFFNKMQTLSLSVPCTTQALILPGCPCISTSSHCTKALPSCQVNLKRSSQSVLFLEVTRVISSIFRHIRKPGLQHAFSQVYASCLYFPNCLNHSRTHFSNT